MHSYFSPYGNPYEASVTYFSVLCDLHYRLKKKTHLADSPFLFATGIDEFTGDVAWTLSGMQEILGRVQLTTLEYHNSEGDFAAWARTSLGDGALAEKMARMQSITGERLRRSLLKAVNAALLEGR